METKGIHHIAIKVADYDRSVAFYRDGMGFLMANQWGEPGKRACMLDMGEGDHIEIFEGRVKSPDEDGHFMHLALKTDDCDSCFERAVNAGAAKMREPFSTDIQGKETWKTRLAFVKGPDGEILEFFQRI